jgi:hypothetical protein
VLTKSVVLLLFAIFCTVVLAFVEAEDFEILLTLLIILFFGVEVVELPVSVV